MESSSTIRDVSHVSNALLFAVLIMLVSGGCTSSETSPSVAGTPPSPTSPTVFPTITGGTSTGSTVRFVLHDTYTVGDTAHIRIENVGDRAYRYQLTYAACPLHYSDGDGRRFLIPPGTHCDIISFGTIEPGETAHLFDWQLDECVRDDWGCVRSEPLSPGTYTIAGVFRPEKTGTNVRASASFDLLPPT